jgi:hypothetical protein
MHHRTRELRAAVARRERNQGQLRAATATVGVAGVVTAGAVAFILPGATHSTASAQTTGTARSPASSQSAPAHAVTSGAKSSGSVGTGHARRHHHHHASQGTAATAPSAPPSAPAPAPSTAPPQTTSGGS